MTEKSIFELDRFQVRTLFREEELLELKLELFEEGDWEIEGDWQLLTNIYRQTDTGKYYMITISRSGSPYSDYHYSFEDQGETLTEVERVEKKVVTVSWVEVK